MRTSTFVVSQLLKTSVKETTLETGKLVGDTCVMLGKRLFVRKTICAITSGVSLKRVAPAEIDIIV